MVINFQIISFIITIVNYKIKGYNEKVKSQKKLIKFCTKEMSIAYLFIIDVNYIVSGREKEVIPSNYCYL